MDQPEVTQHDEMRPSTKGADELAMHRGASLVLHKDLEDRLGSDRDGAD